METDPALWIQALRHSHDRLRAVAGPLGLGQLQRPSYAAAWSIAQVLSHLGSQAEVFGLFLDAGLTGEDPPGRATFTPIWQAWNAKSAQAQAGDALRADLAVTERFESLDAGQCKRLRLKVFGMELDTAGLARMRLGEHAIRRRGCQLGRMGPLPGQRASASGCAPTALPPAADGARAAPGRPGDCRSEGFLP